MDELTRTVVPMINTLWPAIQGLLRLPALLSEHGGESAEVLSRWDQNTAMLRAPGAGAEEEPAHTAMASQEGTPSAADSVDQAPPARDRFAEPPEDAEA